eukprot:1078202-Pleurochrysis_carterae.AAC.7
MARVSEAEERSEEDAPVPEGVDEHRDEDVAGGDVHDAPEVASKRERQHEAELEVLRAEEQAAQRQRQPERRSR